MYIDAHERPPEFMRKMFRKWQKSSEPEIATSSGILDFSRPHSSWAPRVRSTIFTNADSILAGFKTFTLGSTYQDDDAVPLLPECYEINTLPGLFVYPALIPWQIQNELLNRLIHRDLSNPIHKTNLHLHYDISYPSRENGNRPTASFFNADMDTVLVPKDSSVHRPITVKQMLDKKLRWMTLGGQYDWTAKAYPTEVPPSFPLDIATLLRSGWPDVDAQAAILNFYTPGDTLSVHRDVSEDCDRGLISVSMGCDAVFIAGLEDDSEAISIRLRSGDVLLMSGKSRFAWHAVPKVLSNTCSASLVDWPATDDDSDFDQWRGWLQKKRINLNVRQMRANSHESAKIPTNFEK